MIGERGRQNLLQPTAPGATAERGDVPADLRGRYLIEGRGAASLGFFLAAKATVPAFRDRGDRLVANQTDPDIVRDMVLIAGHRGWFGIWSRGSEAFKREAWVCGMAMGLAVFNYYGTARDIEAASRRHEQRFERPGLRADPVAREAFNSLDPTGEPESWMRVAEAVVKARLANPADREMALGRVQQSINFAPDNGWEFYPDYARRQNERRRARLGPDR